MGKDLKQQFNRYFDGAEISEGLAEDAAKYVPERRTRTTLYKAVGAAACAVLALTVTFAYFGGRSIADRPNGAETPDNPNSNEAVGDGSQTVYYAKSALTATYSDPYEAIEAYDELSVLGKMIYADNCAVEELTLFTDDSGTLCLAGAEVAFIYGMTRYDALIYFELTDAVCEDFAHLIAPFTLRYNTIDYRYEAEFENGEYVYSVYASDGGVKYYISLKTSDGEGYLKILSMLS